MSSDLKDLYQEVVLEHSKRPRNFRVVEGATCAAEGYNPLCGDQLSVTLKLEDGVIRDIGFQGQGCAISKASASLMTGAVKDKTREEAEALFARVHTLVTEGPDKVDPESLGKLAVLSGVSEFPARVKCASLAWHTLHAALDGRSTSVSTE
ncbi:Fe-S cluster assembly sulfur transfer protein SufU [Corallococcus carmarthensis]|uniref:SUF system NifU family Fe-S cluster assembly protein n=1 Tax=Corallococcus carmarthensis TaxID=2316728 RepID=A0A3A8JXC6_9BACT|nr:SUF system NifU family Fe-S cluster assembly protein [Corallococcus carmarthensis]NOK21469.1 SUF system NifU family Fe-S cluster assembly protein [Corallococcus carmarthensis]RKG96470.1 SUF system NifU family Fe-S cluster assembly protein [Corallococcus carmarthensis]